MKKIILLSLCLVMGAICHAEKIRVACIGDSITYGAFIEDRDSKSYPAQLQEFLGQDYDVRNFGVNGATLLHKGDNPYIRTGAYRSSLEFNPHIVLIKLGTNDSKPHNRVHLEAYKQQYLELIDAYATLSSKPRIILLTPVKCFIPGENDICDRVISDDIIPKIKEIAYERDIEIINMHNMFGDKWDQTQMPDRLHPSGKGTGRMAKKIYEYLSVKECDRDKVIASFPLKPVREFNFHGFKGYAYDDNGIECYIVKPHHAAEGRPWIWRARFWGHEPQTDIALLEQGFHLTYCDVSDLYGSPEAVKRWDRFYSLVRKAGLDRKAVLEGMSRGGLIIYNWAGKNPRKTACIYGDAPVMDLKTWPLRQDPPASLAECIPVMMKAYGFRNAEDVLAWKGNPVDHARKLAKAKVAMIHVVGDADIAVPVEDNTTVFEKLITGYGHEIKVIHKPGTGHHPHSLYDPEPIVDYILEATGQKTAASN
ncbi:MAG: hypothetical protein E7124_06535 [Bacteroidales bacterium]|nr:hypothetical protein [Bacteroidales bacterium]